MQKASQKLNALTRIAFFMDVDKRQSVMKAFIGSHFYYCHLVWMFRDRPLNNKIN